MKILVCQDEKAENTVVYNTYQYIKKNNLAEVNFSTTKFWSSSTQTQPEIIHIHWPEYIFPWLNWNNVPSLQDLEKLNIRLKEWTDLGSRIILTRHNTLPHHRSEIFPQLYNLIYKYTSGIIHLGEYSLNEFKRNEKFTSLKHTVIPHPWYPNVKNEISKSAARSVLGINDGHFLFLSFGRIRKFQEQELLIKAFTSCSLSNATLLITRGLPHALKPSFKKSPLSRLLWEYKQALFERDLYRKNIHINYGFLNNYEIQTYMNAADIVVIPRLSTLNSGVLPLAFSFGKSVIGPAVGNIKEILEETGNLSFEPNPNSLEFIMRKAVNEPEEKGRANYAYAEENWNIKKIGKMHLDFFRDVLM